MAKYKIRVSFDEMNFFWIVVDNGRLIRNPTKEDLKDAKDYLKGKSISYNKTNICDKCREENKKYGRELTDKNILYPKNAYHELDQKGHRTKRWLCKNCYNKDWKKHVCKRERYQDSNSNITKGDCYLELVNDNDVKKRFHTRKQLIEILQQWIKKNERIPSQSDFDKNPELPNYKTYTNEFDSWPNAIVAAGFKPNDTTVSRGRQGEMQTISEFKTECVVDLSGENRNSTCDGICPKGDMFDTKSASPTKKHGYWGWIFFATISQLKEADYLFLRAYADRDFTKRPLYVWRVPIEFMNGRTTIFIYKDKKYSRKIGMLNVENMKEYEILDE